MSNLEVAEGEGFSLRPSYRGQVASPHLNSTPPEFLSTHIPKWFQVSHELVILINNLDPIFLSKLEPFVETLRWVSPIPSLVLSNSLSERFALPGNHLLELRLGIRHSLRNGM